MDDAVGLTGGLGEDVEVVEAAAERAFRQALSLQPSSVEILNDLGISLARQGKTAEAIVLYERALKLKPGDTPTEEVRELMWDAAPCSAFPG